MKQTGLVVLFLLTVYIAIIVTMSTMRDGGGPRQIPPGAETHYVTPVE